MFRVLIYESVNTIFSESAEAPDRFTVSFLHNGYFCGLKEYVEYEDSTLDYYDNCCTDTFSLLWIEDFVWQGGNEVT
jgi:hypothetical protein